MEANDEVVERQKLVPNDIEVEEEITPQAPQVTATKSAATTNIKSISSGDTTRSRNSASCSIERTMDKGVSSAKVTYVNERKARNLHGNGDEKFEFKPRPRKLLKDGELTETPSEPSVSSAHELSNESADDRPQATPRPGRGKSLSIPSSATHTSTNITHNESSDKFDDRPIKHHSFVSEVPDVKHMERALLGLLDDFHSGKLKAFGSGCTMDQMTKIREQQESLAKLHFELAAAEDDSLDSGRDLNAAKAQENMLQLVHRLEQLSVSIEQLQTSHTGP